MISSDVKKKIAVSRVLVMKNWILGVITPSFIKTTILMKLVSVARVLTK